MIMYRKEYCKFVRSSTYTASEKVLNTISGEEAKKLYLEEIENNQGNSKYINSEVHSDFINCKVDRQPEKIEISNLELFRCVQDNNIDTLRRILNVCPGRINTVDEYGWSLLMIACQANSIETVKELLKRGIDTTIRDKAGNSAQSLIIKNKNAALATILVNHSLCFKQNEFIKQPNHKRFKEKYYVCKICDSKIFTNKQEHLSSTIHNINASKDRKIPTNYVIPESNKGYQIMVKVGWDKETGLGPHGSGQKYPIKTVQKNDKKGLGHENKKLKTSTTNESTKLLNKKQLESEYQKNRRIEINFRRQFY